MRGIHFRAAFSGPPRNERTSVASDVNANASVRASLSLWNGALSICFTTERASRHGARNRYWVTKSTVHKVGESKI